MELSRVESLNTKKKLDFAVSNSFRHFLQRGFFEISPNSRLQNAWYLDLIIEYLEAVERGEIKRLIINMPPRHLKSLTINVFWSAWLLGRNPSLKIISTSYSHNLSVKHSQDTRYIINSAWYKNLFPQTMIPLGANRQSKFITTKQGFRLATSVGGTLTGEGGDVLIVDDPHTPIQAQSTKHRNKALNWFDQTLMTRLNSPNKGRVVVVMQRLHKKDLSGHLLEKKDAKWHHLNIPAFEEETKEIKFNNFFQTRKPYETLCNEICDYNELMKIKGEIGSYAFAAQFLQKPISDKGQLIKIEWLKRYDINEIGINEFTYCFQSWDCAFKTGQNNDYSVCATFGIKNSKIYLLDIMRGKFEFSELKQMVKKKYLQYNPKAVLVEDKASGQVLIQDLMKKYTIPIIKVRPRLDKLARFVTNLNLFEAGIIYFPQDSSWLLDFLNELSEFPNSKHDDQVDACTQFLNWWQKEQQNLIQIREV